MNKRKLLMSIVLAIFMMFMISTAAIAAPYASILYTETYLSGSDLWQYDYTFYNTSDAGESLYSVYFYFAQDTSFTGTALPTGWDGIVWDGNTWTINFADTYSTATENDIAAGNSLSGFSFTVDYRAGDIAYDAYISGDNIYSGTTAITPEPISSVLFLTGGAVFAGRRFMRRKRI